MAVAMRRCLRTISVIGSVLVLLVCGATLSFRSRANIPALSVTPTGQPRFQTSGAGIFGIVTEVYLSVAVTNKTPSTLIGHVGVTAGDNLGPNPSFVGDEFFRLSPRSGKACTVHYGTSYAKWVLGADYLRVRSPAEVRLRAFLCRLHIPRVTTNDDWHSVIVGQIAQN